MLGKGKCMSLYAFCCYFQNLIQQKVGTEYKVSVDKIKSNNNYTMTVLAMLNRKTHFCPVIYMDNYYREYADGRYTLEDAKKAIISLCDLHMDFENYNVYLHDWNSAKEKLMYCVVNYQSNKELLKHVPYKRFLDLAVMFYLYFGKGRTALVDNVCLENWNVNLTEEDLFRISHYNTARTLGFDVQNVENIMEQPETIGDVDYRLVAPEGMYILSNETGEYGAGTMLYDNLFTCIADETGGEELFILPSSIHELIIIPVSESSVSLDKLLEVVSNMNMGILSPEEILSTHVYKYTRETKEITIAK